MESLEGVKAGDKLFIKSNRYDHGHIETVDRVTPTGRVVTKSGTFDQHGYRRGDSGWHICWARRATEDDIAGVNRYSLVCKLKDFKGWEKLSPDDLKAATAIIEKYKLPGY